MINKIIGTIGARIFSGIVLLLILGLHSKYLGVVILGHLAVFRLSATINHLIASVFSGPAIVYLGNRISINKLVIPTFVWVFASVILISFCQVFLNLVPEKYFYHLLLYSFLLSTQTFFEQALLIKQKVKQYNISSFIYHAVLLLSNAILIYYFSWRTDYVFFISSYIALTFSLIFLFVSVYKQFNLTEFKVNSKIALIILKYGIWVQMNNFIQTMNNRFCLLLLDHYWGKSAVGLFSAGLQLAEAIWIIAKSLATVQYARISANKSVNYAMSLTLLMSKVSLFVSALACVCLYLFPENFIVYYLGKDFINVKTTILLLLPGILFFSISLIYCHFYSGTGKFYINTIGSLITLIVIVISSLIFIPIYGVNGAALINTIGFAAMFLFYLLLLLFKEKVAIKSILPAKNDIRKSFDVVKEYLKG